MGVDFGPYLALIVKIVRKNWYTLIPPTAYPPISRQGKVSIEFVGLKDGKVSGMTVHTTSGDVALDRAAWASITASDPFPPLPTLFPGQRLGLRFYFFYNLSPALHRSVFHRAVTFGFPLAQLCNLLLRGRGLQIRP